jgi:hypothetical protein
MIASDNTIRPLLTSSFLRVLQIGLLLGIGTDLVLLTVRVILYPAFFAMPGALTFLCEPLLPLGVYAIVIGALPRITLRIPHRLTMLHIGAMAGLLGGTIEVVSTALESLVSLPQVIVSVTTGVAQVSLFLAFAAAGFFCSRRTRRFWSGLSAAICSAMVAIVVVVTFGFVLINLFLPTLAHDEIDDPDYLRSGWTDVRAFAIANLIPSMLGSLTWSRLQSSLPCLVRQAAASGGGESNGGLGRGPLFNG